MAPVAIDIEKKKLLTALQKEIVISFMFNHKDCVSCSKLKRENYFKLWAIKEVYSKYFGEGLYMDFKEIRVEQDDFDIYGVTYKNKNRLKVKIVDQYDYVVAYICNDLRGEK